MNSASGSPLLLAIDNGTQSVRALVFDLDGEQVAAEKVPIEPYFSEHPGWAEQHVTVFWDALCAACRGVASAPGVDAGRIVGMAVTTQRATVVNLDEHGEPLRPAIIWLDQRRCLNPPDLPKSLVVAARLSGKSGILSDLRTEAECNWIAEHQPEVARATRRFLLLSGYLNWRLTGDFKDSVAAQVGYLPFDFQRQQWASARNASWRALALLREQLPELVPTGARIGELTTEAAGQTGLHAGLPVIATGTDKACEVLGSGCLDPTVGSISYGTTATVNTANSRYVSPTRSLPAYPAATPGHWNSELNIRRGYWMVEWFRREFGADVFGAEVASDAVYSRLDELLAETPAGADGLLLQPYWSAGTPFPGAEARGAVIGFSDIHGRAHLYRAIVEGIAHALYGAGRRLENRNGVPIERLRVAGGGSRSDAVMQITADVFGRAAERPHVTEAGGLGAAINVAVGMGLHPGYETAVAKMTRVDARFEPDLASHRLYRRIHDDVYRPMYGRLAPLYRAIREITGYPP